ncbi:MAG TPA: rhodanese-like domain-containing protein [Woeseiaceae bacterium]|nr:rhodanese-like domain-containing protein [Woeseiaceae bacterium]
MQTTYHIARTLTLCLLLNAAALADEPDAVSPASTVPAESLAAYLHDPGTFTLIDARSPEEYAAAHVAGAINIPHDALALHRAALTAAPDAPIVVYCRTGRRAGLLRDELLAQGFTDVRVLEGDRIEWVDGAGTFRVAPAEPGAGAGSDAKDEPDEP